MKLNHQLRRVAVVAIRLEIISLVLFFMVPIDVGYPPGTPFIYQVPAIGLWLHFPWLFLKLDNLPFVVAFPLLILVGYLDILALLLIFVVPYLGIRSVALKNKARFTRYVVIGIGVALATTIATWVGTRYYLRGQVTSLIVDLNALDHSSDPTGFAEQLAQKYRRHFVRKSCEGNYCRSDFIFNNRVLSNLRVAPKTEIDLSFEHVGNSLRDVTVVYTSAVFKENSPIVYVTEGFCATPDSLGCTAIFAMSPHGRDVSETWNGDVGFSKSVRSDLKNAAWGLNPDCFIAFKGCRDISRFDPGLWRRTALGISSCVRSDSDSIAELAQPLDCAR